jgi:hypothetical protein
MLGKISYHWAAPPIQQPFLRAHGVQDTGNAGEAI